MMLTLSSSRSAIALNCWLSSRSSSVPWDSSSDATRDDRSPSASRRLASVSRVSGVVNRWARNAATSTATRNATLAMISSRAVTLASVLARLVYGFDSVTIEPPGRRVGRDEVDRLGRDRGVLRLARLGLHLEVGREHEVRLRLDDGDAVRVRPDEADRDSRVRLGDRLGGEAEHLALEELARPRVEDHRAVGQLAEDDLVVGHRPEHERA